MNIIKYTDDKYLWHMQQAEFLASAEFNKLDYSNLKRTLEIIADLDIRDLKKHFTVLLFTLLNWYFHPSERTTQNHQFIFEQRKNIQFILEDSPSLKLFLEQQFAETWKHIVDALVDPEKLDAYIQPIWTIDEMIDDDFFPELYQN